MGTEFAAIFLFILVAILTAVGMLAASALFSPGRGRENPVKQMPYESGMDPIGDARQRFDVRYYLVAIAFLLFDMELLFLYPWAVGQWSADAPVAVAKAVDGATTTAAAVTTHGVGIPPEFRNLAFFGAMVFVAVVVAGFAYDWRKGVFEWR